MILRPVFVIGKTDNEVKMATSDDVECTLVKCDLETSEGKKISFDIPYQNLMMLIYFCANEEERQKMQIRIQRQITEIPYEVTFKLDKGEIEAGMAKRLIKLPVDNITMAIARSEAQLFAGKANLGNMNDWFKHRTAERKRSNRLREK